MRIIGNALNAYANTYDTYPEPGANLKKRLTSGGFCTPRQFTCPSDNSAAGSSYHYVPGYAPGGDAQQIVVYEDSSNHNGEGGNVLYLDGRVIFVRGPQLKQLIS